MCGRCQRNPRQGVWFLLQVVTSIHLAFHMHIVCCISSNSPVWFFGGRTWSHFSTAIYLFGFILKFIIKKSPRAGLVIELPCPFTVWPSLLSQPTKVKAHASHDGSVCQQNIGPCPPELAWIELPNSRPNPRALWFSLLQKGAQGQQNTWGLVEGVVNNITVWRSIQLWTVLFTSHITSFVWPSVSSLSVGLEEIRGPKRS